MNKKNPFFFLKSDHFIRYCYEMQFFFLVQKFVLLESTMCMYVSMTSSEYAYICVHLYPCVYVCECMFDTCRIHNLYTSIFRDDWKNILSLSLHHMTRASCGFSVLQIINRYYLNKQKIQLKKKENTILGFMLIDNQTFCNSLAV